MTTPLLLTSKEVTEALTLLAGRGTERRRKVWRNELCIFALVTCAGLTATDIAALNIGDFRDEVPPHFELPGRLVPLHWHPAAGAAIQEHYRWRKSQGAADSEPFMCAVMRDAAGNAMKKGNVTNSYATACRIVGISADRKRISLGVESFTRNAIAAGVETDAIRYARGMLMTGERCSLDPLSCLYDGALNGFRP
jgi:hypothetical protein